MNAWKLGAAAALLASALAAVLLAGPPAKAPAAPAAAPQPHVIPTAAPAPGPAVQAVQAVEPAAAPAPAAQGGPTGKLEAKETIFDAGAVERGVDVVHAFQLKNIGLGDLTVDAKPG